MYCRTHGHVFLRSMLQRFSRAIVMFDLHGCGGEICGREQIEAEVTGCLEKSGWFDRARAIVLDPELEIWVWSDSPEVDRCLGWAGRRPNLRAHLEVEGIWPAGMGKPADPKKAMELSLRKVQKARSSSLYKNLAASVSFQRCVDPSFNRLLETFRAWFPMCLNDAPAIDRETQSPA